MCARRGAHRFLGGGHRGRCRIDGLRCLVALRLAAADDGLLLRFTGETLALAPPFIATAVEIRSAVDTLRRALVATAAQAGQAP